MFKKLTSEQKGFGIVEALMACAIFSIAFVGFLSLSSYAINQTHMLVERTKANLIAHMMLEEMIINQENLNDYEEQDLKNIDNSGSINIRKQKEKWKKLLKKDQSSNQNKDITSINVNEKTDSYTSKEKKQIVIEIKRMNEKVKIHVGRIFNKKH